MNYLGILIGVACAIFFYRAAEYERMSPWLWVVASLGLTTLFSMLTSGLTMVLLGQVGLFIVMWGYNVQRASRHSK